MGFEIYIKGTLYRRWTAADVQLTYDSAASAFSIESSFDTQDTAQKELLKSLSYPKVEIYVGARNPADDSNLLLTGVMTDDETSSTASPGGIRIGGYSLSGVLLDCEIPLESYPLQDDGKTLREITNKVLAPFGVNLFVNQVARTDAAKTVKQAKAGETEKAASYITKLAAQFNIIVGNTRQGELLFTRVLGRGATPRGVYVEGEGSFTSISKSVQGRQIFSRYTVLRQTEVDDNSPNNPQETVSETIVGAFRPQVKQQSTGGADTTGNAAKSARMAGYKAVRFVLTVSTFFYVDGSIIKPNRVIKVKAPSIGLDTETELFVQQVTLSETAAGQTAVLTCLFKGALTGERVEGVF